MDNIAGFKKPFVVFTDCLMIKNTHDIKRKFHYVIYNEVDFFILNVFQGIPERQIHRQKICSSTDIHIHVNPKVYSYNDNILYSYISSPISSLKFEIIDDPLKKYVINVHIPCKETKEIKIADDSFESSDILTRNNVYDKSTSFLWILYLVISVCNTINIDTHLFNFISDNISMYNNYNKKIKIEMQKKSCVNIQKYSNGNITKHGFII